MAKKLSGLGRGLDALFPTNFSTSEVIHGVGSSVSEVELILISPKLNQPRTVFDDEKIEQLSYSIKEHGVLQPLVLVDSGSGKFTIIAGERRYRAAHMAGLKKVPAVIRTASELEQLEIALVENIQREDLSSLEQAVSIKKLHEEFSQSMESIAKRLGKAMSTVSNTLRLLTLPEQYQKALFEGLISDGHARQLLALSTDVRAQSELFKNIIDHHWSVRKAELFVSSHKDSGGSTQKIAKKLQTETKETKSLSQRLKTTVRIKRSAKGGQVTIAFKDDKDLARLLKEL